jgi:hypothetical protein
MTSHHHRSLKEKIMAIVLPTRKMTDEQLAEQMHFARRAGADVNRHREARKGKGKGGRNAWKRDV